MLALSRYLVARGHHLQIVCQRAEEKIDAEIFLVSAPGIFGEPARLLWFASRAAKKIASLSAEVSFTSSHVYGADVVRLEGGLVADHRAAVGGNLAELAAESIEKKKLAMAKHILVLSERDRARVNDPRARVVRNGIDAARFTEQKTRPDRPYSIGFIGNGFERKNLSAVIDAVARLPNSRLLVAGNDRRTADYALAARGIDARFLGPLADVRPLFAELDVLAMPSLYEPFGLVALEAWASGVPVVLSAIAGASEIAPHPELVLQNPRDVSELVVALQRSKAVDRRLCRPVAETYSNETSFAEIEVILSAR